MSTDEHAVLGCEVDQRVSVRERELIRVWLRLHPSDCYEYFRATPISTIPKEEELTASHFIEFSGVTLPNSRMVTCESVGLLNRFESDAVPMNARPFALKALSRPVAASAAGVETAATAFAVDVASATALELEVLTTAAAAPGTHCE